MELCKSLKISLNLDNRALFKERNAWHIKSLSFVIDASCTRIPSTSKKFWASQGRVSYTHQSAHEWWTLPGDILVYVVTNVAFRGKSIEVVYIFKVTNQHSKAGLHDERTKQDSQNLLKGLSLVFTSTLQTSRNLLNIHHESPRAFLTKVPTL